MARIRVSPRYYDTLVRGKFFFILVLILEYMWTLALRVVSELKLREGKQIIQIGAGIYIHDAEVRTFIVLRLLTNIYKILLTVFSYF